MVCGGSLSHLSQLTGILEQKRALIQTEFLEKKKRRERDLLLKKVLVQNMHVLYQRNTHIYLNKGKQNSDLPRSLNVLSLQHCHRGNKVLFNSVTT